VNFFAVKRHFSEFFDCFTAEKNIQRSKEKYSFLRGGGTNSLSLSSPPTMVTSFTLFDAPRPTPVGWWRHPSSSRLLLARDNDDGGDVHHCCFRCVVVVLIVMLVVVLLLSVIPSRCCCHRRRCHHRTTNAQRPSPSPRPPPSPLPSQSHLLQPSPPPSPRCRFHRRRHHPRHRIDNANSLNAAIASCRHCRGHRHH